MGLRLSILQLFAVLASASSGLISYGVFQIDHPTVQGWQWLFIIEGSMTFLTGIIGFFWLPAGPQNAWFLNERERAAANARLLRDNSVDIETSLDLKECFQTWRDWKFPVWCIITLTYPVAYATAMNFFPLVSQTLANRLNRLTLAGRLLGGWAIRSSKQISGRSLQTWSAQWSCSAWRYRRIIFAKGRFTSSSPWYCR